MRQEIVIVKCDVHNSEKCEGLETRDVVLDGVHYQGEYGAECLDDVKVGYVKATFRKVASNVRAITSARSARSLRAGSNSKAENAEIREEAAKRGVKVAPRGRIPEPVIDAFRSGDWSKLASTPEPVSEPEPVKSEPEAPKAPTQRRARTPKPDKATKAAAAV